MEIGYVVDVKKNAEDKQCGWVRKNKINFVTCTIQRCDFLMKRQRIL